ncbi:carbonic anhydrase 2 isoform X2 [Agrilus planipennis]|nr:carbonic anhydrase 2 isoform X2 [Agrilus planipennis]
MGPNHWGEWYHQCVGKHQSPINIVEHDVEIVELPKLRFVNFDLKIEEVELHNNGHTVVLLIRHGPLPIILGGPLTGKYQFAQLHFHWGQNDAEGSENRINNGSFPMELHVVFFKASYGSFKEATEHPDGLTVLSFLYSTSRQSNPTYDKFVQMLPMVEKPKSSTIITNFPTFDDLTLTDRDAYFTYGGSLTTPPCSEVVTWIEFKKTIPLSHNQIQYFRQLNDHNGKLLHNFRPVQPLYGRTIRLSISPEWNTLFSDVEKNNKATPRNDGMGIKIRNFSIYKIAVFAVFVIISRIVS